MAKFEMQISPPWRCPVAQRRILRIAQKIEISALHQFCSDTDQPDRAIAQVVRFPARAHRNARLVEENLRYGTIAFAGQMAVERAKGEYEPLASLRCQPVTRASAFLARYRSPQMERGLCAHSKMRVERNDGGKRRRRTRTAGQYELAATLFVPRDPMFAISAMAHVRRREVGYTA
jgi:hypothetical protein